MNIKAESVVFIPATRSCLWRLFWFEPEYVSVAKLEQSEERCVHKIDWSVELERLHIHPLQFRSSTALVLLISWAHGMHGPACICRLLVCCYSPLLKATVMEFAKYFHKETDKTHRWKIKVTYEDVEDQEQEREWGNVQLNNRCGIWKYTYPKSMMTYLWT